MEPALGEAGRHQPAAGENRTRACHRGAARDLPGAVPPGAAGPPRSRPHVAPPGRKRLVRWCPRHPGIGAQMDCHYTHNGTTHRSGCAAWTAATASTPRRTSARCTTGTSGITCPRCRSHCRTGRARSPAAGASMRRAACASTTTTTETTDRNGAPCPSPTQPAKPVRWPTPAEIPATRCRPGIGRYVGYEARELIGQLAGDPDTTGIPTPLKRANHQDVDPRSEDWEAGSLSLSAGGLR